MAVKTWHMQKRMDAMRKDMKGFMDFYDWGKKTRIVVRNKASHEDVVTVNVLDLYMQFRMGRAFRNAHLLFDNNQFKVYAQHTPKD